MSRCSDPIVPVMSLNRCFPLLKRPHSADY